MKKVKGTGQWAGKSVPGMYQDGGDFSVNKNILKNSKKGPDFSIKKAVKKGPDISVAKSTSAKPAKNLSKKGLDGIKNAFKTNRKTMGKKAGKRVAKQIAKKAGWVGLAYTAYDVLKDPKGALNQIKTDVKNVKNFIKGNKGKSETPKKKITPKKKDTKLQSMKKGNYVPQSQKK